MENCACNPNPDLDISYYSSASMHLDNHFLSCSLQVEQCQLGSYCSIIRKYILMYEDIIKSSFQMAVRLNFRTLMGKAEVKTSNLYCKRKEKNQSDNYIIDRYKQNGARVSVEMSRWVKTESHLCVCSQDMWSCQEKPSDQHVSRAAVDSGLAYTPSSSLSGKKSASA